MRSRNIVVGIFAVLAAGITIQSGASAADSRSYTSGKFGLDLNGVFAGWVTSATGGDQTTDVVVANLGPDNLQKKSIAGVKYTDITIKNGDGMSKSFYNLVSSTFRGEYTRVNGAITAVDFDGNGIQQTAFTNALLTEITFPAADGGSKEAGTFQWKLTPETTRQAKATVGKVGGAFNQAKVKRWTLGNFKVQIDGVDASRVQKVDSFTVKQTVLPDAIGTTRATTQAARITWPNIVLTMTTANDAAFVTWQNQQATTNSAHKNGSLSFLDETMINTIFKVAFSDLRIVSIVDVPAGADGVKHVKITLSPQGGMALDATNASYD